MRAEFRDGVRFDHGPFPEECVQIFRKDFPDDFFPVGRCQIDDVDDCRTVNDLFQNLREEFSEEDFVVYEHPITENNSDDGHSCNNISLLGFFQGGIDEGSDPWFPDDISVFGQGFHRFADGRTAASELFGEFLRGGQLESFSTRPVNPVQDVAPDFHVFR